MPPSVTTRETRSLWVATSSLHLPNSTFSTRRFTLHRYGLALQDFFGSAGALPVASASSTSLGVRNFRKSRSCNTHAWYAHACRMREVAVVHIQHGFGSR